MKDQIPEELLSAYFDGELSANERIQVEHWLNSSPEARQQVADYRRLSRMFEGLSRTEVPQEFPTEVLQLAERRMLLPDASPLPRRMPIRLWWVAVPTATAAALLLIFNMSNRNAGPDRAEMVALDRAAQRDQDLPGRGAGGDDPLLKDLHREVAVQDRPNSQDMPDAAVPADGPAKSRDVAESKTPVAEKSNDVADGAPAATDSESDPQVAAVLDDAVRGVRDADSDVHVLSAVTIYVDGTDGLALVQKYLEDNQITAADGAEQEQAGAGSGKKASKAVASLAADKQALCVVVTEPDRLVRAFTKMIRESHPSMRIAAEDPIVMTALDDDSQARFAQAEREVSRSLERVAELVAKDKVAIEPGKAGATPAASAREDGRKPASAVAKKPADVKPAPGSALAKRGASAGGPRSKALLMDDRGAEKTTSARVKPPTDEVDVAHVDTDADEELSREPMSRQLVVSVPPAYQNRARSSASKNRRAQVSQRTLQIQPQPTADDKTAPVKFDSVKPDAVKSDAVKSDAVKSDTVKSDADEKAATPAPALVRMLIMVEQESSPPAAAAPE